MSISGFSVTRRGVLTLAGVAGASIFLAAWTKSRQLAFGTALEGMAPGDYTWAPDRAPEGELIAIVSLPEQRVHVYRGGTLMAVSTCSTGREGHRTPTGVFSVLQKDADHVSSTYKGAAMPFMERLTWTGIALHAGNLPGYPASHGCIRLPLEFARKLFEISHLGMVVILADQHSEPSEVVHPGIFLPEHAAQEAAELVTKVSGKPKLPGHRQEHGQRPAKILVSIADKSITVFEDGHVVAKGPISVRDPGRAVGDHVFVLKRADASGRAFVWTATSYRQGDDASGRMAATEASVINRITTDTTTAEAIQTLMHPGLMMVITDAPAPDDTRSHRSFVIATHHEPEDWKTRVFQN